jgi:FAD/FMN-containing dehydrogenase
MPTRREFLRTLALLSLAPPSLSAREREIWLNDIHSQLNRTRIRTLLRPRTETEVIDAVRLAVGKGNPLSVCGSRHSMGGQQFLTDGICVDTRSLSQVRRFDRERGLIETDAGIQWPQLIKNYLDLQQNSSRQWGIAQKQTGADTFTLGGSLSSNIHGRGLAMKPLISNVESFTLIDESAKMIRCSRTENFELFRLAIGGYGLFGLISTVTLQLVPRRKLRRVVEIIDRDDLKRRFEERIADGYLYGDFQYSIDEKSSDFLRRGVFSCYQPNPFLVPSRFE